MSKKLVQIKAGNYLMAVNLICRKLLQAVAEHTWSPTRKVKRQESLALMINIS